MRVVELLWRVVGALLRLTGVTGYRRRAYTSQTLCRVTELLHFPGHQEAKRRSPRSQQTTKQPHTGSESNDMLYSQSPGQQTSTGLSICSCTVGHTVSKPCPEHFSPVNACNFAPDHHQPSEKVAFSRQLYACQPGHTRVNVGAMTTAYVAAILAKPLSPRPAFCVACTREELIPAVSAWKRFMCGLSAGYGSAASLHRTPTLRNR